MQWHGGKYSFLHTNYQLTCIAYYVSTAQHTRRRWSLVTVTLELSSYTTALPYQYHQNKTSNPTNIIIIVVIVAFQSVVGIDHLTAPFPQLFFSFSETTRPVKNSWCWCSAHKIISQLWGCTSTSSYQGDDDTLTHHVRAIDWVWLFVCLFIGC